jgi:hypothetical protein
MTLRSLYALGLVAVAACGAPSAGSRAQADANAVTRAVYDDNPSEVIAHFDAAIKPTVSRAEVGVLSDKMHSLGSWQGITYLGTDASTNEYTYRARFQRGSMDVVVRLDPKGKLSAYRVFPGG